MYLKRIPCNAIANDYVNEVIGGAARRILPGAFSPHLFSLMHVSSMAANE